MAKKSLSKSKRVKNYIAKKPESANKDIVKALARFGVTAVDVANVRSQLRKKEGDVSVGQRKGEFELSQVEASGGSRLNGNFALTDIDAAVRYVESIGSIQRAHQLLDVVDHIRGLQTV